MTWMELVCLHFTNHHRNDERNVFTDFIESLSQEIIIKRFGTPAVWKTIVDMVCLYAFHHNEIIIPCYFCLAVSSLHTLGMDVASALQVYWQHCYDPQITDFAPSVRPVVLQAAMAFLSVGLPTYHSLAALRALLDNHENNLGPLLTKFLDNFDWNPSILNKELFRSFAQHNEGKLFLKCLCSKTGGKGWNWYFSHCKQMPTNEVIEHFNSVINILSSFNYEFTIFRNKRLMTFFNLTSDLRLVCLKKWDESTSLGKLFLITMFATYCDINSYIQVTQNLTIDPEFRPRLTRKICSCFRYFAVDVKKITESFPKLTVVNHLHSLIPQSVLLELCYSESADGASDISYYIKAISASASLPLAATFIKNNRSILKQTAAVASCAKFSYLNFLVNPGPETFCEFKVFCEECNPCFMRDCLQMRRMPPEYSTEFTSLVWNSILKIRNEKLEKYKNNFLNSISEDDISSISLPVLKTVFKNSFNTQFIFMVLLHTEDENWIEILRPKLKDKGDIKNLITFVICKAIDKGVSGLTVVNKFLANETILCNSGYLEEVYLLNLLNCYLKAEQNIDQFCRLVIEYFNSFPDYGLRFSLLASCLTSFVIRFLPVSLLKTLDTLANMSYSRLDLITFAVCLSKCALGICNGGYYTVDYLNYLSIKEILCKTQDPIIDTYLHHNLHIEAF